MWASSGGRLYSSLTEDNAIFNAHKIDRKSCLIVHDFIIQLYVGCELLIKKIEAKRHANKNLVLPLSSNTLRGYVNASK